MKEEFWHWRVFWTRFAPYPGLLGAGYTAQFGVFRRLGATSGRGFTETGATSGRGFMKL